MFASHLPRWTASLRRAAALVKAFALLEDAPRSAPTASRPRRLSDTPPLRLTSGAACHAGAVAELDDARTHPHRRTLRARSRRRDGAVTARPMPCTVPIVRRSRDERAAPVRNARWAALTGGPSMT
jgi:hypothetical protein